MNKEKIFGFVALCLLILALLPWKAYKQEHAQRIREPVVDTLPADPLQIRRQRKQPDDPADYGIIITEPFAPTRSEKEIADQVQLRLKALKAEFPPETIETVRTKIKEDPLETQRKIKLVSAEIEKLKDTLQEEPYNEAAKHRMEYLIILKTIAEEFGEALPQGTVPAGTQ